MDLQLSFVENIFFLINKALVRFLRTLFYVGDTGTYDIFEIMGHTITVKVKRLHRLYFDFLPVIFDDFRRKTDNFR